MTVIAVDGPVAAGKGTLARRLAAAYGFAYLDTGALYRATAFRLAADGGRHDDEAAAAHAAGAVAMSELDNPRLREEWVGAAASSVARHPAVRQALLAAQRRFAAQPPGGAPGAVLDGRDIGTVVCPDAEVKLFITASIEDRARRRHKELGARGVAVSLATVQADLEQRDQRDQQRQAAPLRIAADAHLLDTTNMDIETAFQAARNLVADQL